MTSRGRRFIVLSATLLALAATAKLGLWQLSRANEKQALQTALDSRSKMSVLQSNELATTAEAAELQHYRRVRLLGKWVTTDTIFLDNRQMEGRPGFFIVTPLKLSGRSDAVLVQRGWSPRNANDRTAVPPVPEAADEVEVIGLVAPPPGRLYDFGSTGEGAIRQNLPLEDFRRETGLALLPMSVLQADSPATRGDNFLRKWPLPAVDIDRHYGYMVQWFALCALIAGLYAWFQLIRPAVLKSRLSRSAAPAASHPLSHPASHDA